MPSVIFWIIVAVSVLCILGCVVYEYVLVGRKAKPTRKGMPIAKRRKPAAPKTKPRIRKTKPETPTTSNQS